MQQRWGAFINSQNWACDSVYFLKWLQKWYLRLFVVCQQEYAAVSECTHIMCTQKNCLIFLYFKHLVPAQIFPATHCNIIQQLLHTATTQSNTNSAHFYFHSLSLYSLLVPLAFSLVFCTSIFDWVVSHTWMSHVTYMNESFYTHEWVRLLCFARVSLKEWHDPHACVTARIELCYVAHMNESSSTYGCVVSNTWMNHATHMNELAPRVMNRNL